MLASPLAPAAAAFATDCRAGLSADPKTLPCKYFYDETGSQLFDRICDLPEYYPTRTETAILRDHGPAIAAAVGPGRLVIEPGSGSSTKTRLLLDRLQRPAGYVPIDISRDHLLTVAAALRREYPDLRVRPVAGDFVAPLRLAAIGRTFPDAPRLVFFPGSTVGNFDPAGAARLLRRFRRWAGDGGAVLVGVDLPKDRRVLEAAYDDAAGVTAAFNRNLLHRINRELDGEFPVEEFDHRAVFNERESRVEMHLVSRHRQRVRVGDAVYWFAAGETIHTENSYKYGTGAFAALAARAGLAVAETWTDEQRWFAVVLLRAGRRGVPAVAAPRQTVA